MTKRMTCLLATVAVLVPAWPCVAADAPVPAVPAAAQPVPGAPVSGSPLALTSFTGDDAPELMLAQRTITRSWGASEDSVYEVVRVPEWRSEGFAAAFSGIVPGAGQLYVGERSGLLYLLGEAAGWAAHLIFRNAANGARDDAEAFVGDPNQAASTWSFERWTAATQSDPANLQAIYDADPGAFYRIIASDPQYLAGWEGAPEQTRDTYLGLEDRADQRRFRSRLAAGAIWLNHVVSAVDALRAARMHNIPLRQNLQLRLRPSWNHDGPSLMAVVEGRF